MALSEQMSLRFTEPQREYIRAEVERLRADPLIPLKVSEADVVRALVEHARLVGTRIGGAPAFDAYEGAPK